MQAFTYESPQSLDQALSLFANAGDKGRALIGGTDLLIQMRAGVTAVGLTYVAGIQSNTLAWPPGAGLKRRGEA